MISSMEADLAMKEEALSRLQPIVTAAGAVIVRRTNAWPCLQSL